ncbi:MAG: SCO family protein [Opitutales bacterium]|nr:SCO family protein [Opitutales bacterium]
MKHSLFLILFTSLVISTQAELITADVQSVNVNTKTFDLININGDHDYSEPFTVRVGDGDLMVDYEGKTIVGEISKSEGKDWLQYIFPSDAEQEKLLNAVNRQLRADTAIRQRRQYRKRGDYGINFAMINERAEYVQFNQFKGKWIMMNFIFTRCRIPEMCPAQTSRMVDMQRMAADQGIDNFHQISVTFDPEYDTPGILTQYAEVKGADTETFSFLTGKHEVMLDVLKQYGVIAFESENIIDHTVTTLLFDPSGKIVYRKDNTNWLVEEFIKRIKK